MAMVQYNFSNHGCLKQLTSAVIYSWFKPIKKQQSGDKV